MKYLKLFVILTISLIVCGCNKEYRLYINDNNIVEKFHMEIESDNKYSYVLDGDFYPLHNDFEHKFKKSLKEKGKNKVLDLEYKYSLKDFINANSFNQCFDDRNIINDDEYYTINLSKPNGCMFNTNYIINIITSNDVVENNANEIKGNKYIWYVENDNKDNFKLNIKIKKGTEKTFKDKYNYISYIIVGIALLGIIVAIIILIKKNKNSKKI